MLLYISTDFHFFLLFLAFSLSGNLNVILYGLEGSADQLNFDHLIGLKIEIFFNSILPILSTVMIILILALHVEKRKILEFRIM